MYIANFGMYIANFEIQVANFAIKNSVGGKYNF